MKRKTSDNRVLMFCGFVALTLVFFACTNKDKFIGTYVPVESHHPELSGLTLELRKDGVGVRHFRGEDVVFEWEAKADEIRIYTKQGGTILGKSENGILEITMPGPATYCFKKLPAE